MLQVWGGTRCTAGQEEQDRSYTGTVNVVIKDFYRRVEGLKCATIVLKKFEKRIHKNC